MNKQELEKQIEFCKSCKEIMQGRIDTLDTELKDLEKPKAEKPLRHGDWWFRDEVVGSIRIYMKEFNEEKRDCVALSDVLITNIGAEHKHEPILGNIFKEIAAISEPLKEFEYNGEKIFFLKTGGLCIRPACIRKNDIPGFILNLRRLYATLIAEAK